MSNISIDETSAEFNKQCRKMGGQVVESNRKGNTVCDLDGTQASVKIKKVDKIKW